MTYVLGAGASVHAGYPLTLQLWPALAAWIINAVPIDSDLRRMVDTVVSVNGPVSDVEALLADIDCGQGPFAALSEGRRNRIIVQMRRGITEYFKQLHKTKETAPLYEQLAGLLETGDAVITFNYDVALERELIRCGKFGVRTGYCFDGVVWPEQDSPEPDSKVIVIKPHGSVNWIAKMFPEGPGKVTNTIGARPFVDAVNFPLPPYPDRVLDLSFPEGGIDDCRSLILPTYNKRFSVPTEFGEEWRPFYESLWSRAREALQSSHRIVLIGYSMPPADHGARAMILGSGNKRAEVVICSGSRSSSLAADFKTCHFEHVTEKGTFEDYLKDC